MTCDRQPTCGSAGATVGPTVSSIPSDMSWIMGIFGTVGTVAGIVAKTASVTILGVSAAAAVWISAAAAAAITIFVVGDFWRKRCWSNQDTQTSCSSGVIQTLVPAFNSATDELFPFSAMHDRADVVVKCDYWFRVENLAAFVWCNTDALTSPILRAYYKNAQVCAAGAGATIGAVVGGVAGIFLGVLAGGAIASAACGPFAWLCLIIALIVAAIVAAVCALVGALAGGQIGKAAAGSSSPTSDSGDALVEGDYVTTKGGILTSGDDAGARVYWFVAHTTLHGGQTSAPPYPPFSHTDPEAVLVPPHPDAC